MSELNLNNQGPRKKKTPAKPGFTTRDLFKIGLLLLLMFYVFSVITGQGKADSGVSAVPADYKPEPRKPPTVFDDEISVVKISPSVSWATAERRIDEMIFAKSKWQTENPGKRILACDHVREAVDDYGYCWIIHYERR